MAYYLPNLRLCDEKPAVRNCLFGFLRLILSAAINRVPTFLWHFFVLLCILIVQYQP